MPVHGPTSLLAAALLSLGVAGGWTGCDPSPPPPEGSAPADFTATPASLALRDLDGATVQPFAPPAARAVTFIFIHAECPIANRYAPEIRRLQAQFAPPGVRWYLVHTDPTVSGDKLRAHQREYDLPGPVLLDPRHELVRLGDVRVTPEAAVFDAAGRRVYHGRIDDRFADFGKARPEPTRRELAEVLRALVEGRPVTTPEQPAIGCQIPPLR